MDDSLRLINLTAFYFGTRVATTPTSPESIISISRRAYRDLSRTLHGISTHPQKTTLINTTHESIPVFITKLGQITSQEVFDDHHDSWCQNRVDFFARHPHNHRSKKFNFTYGQAQKWLNMSLKYLAVIGHPEVSRVYEYLHVPIDSIVYDEAEHIASGIEYPALLAAFHGRDLIEFSTRNTNKVSEAISLPAQKILLSR